MNVKILAMKTNTLLLFVFLFPTWQSCHGQDKTSKMGEEKIIHAVDQSNVLLVKELLAEGADVNARDVNLRSLLMIATYNNDYDMAQLLVSEGADPNLRDNILNSPFLYAGASGYLDLVKLYLENGADFITFNRYNGSALIPAAEKGHVEVVRLLANTDGYPVNHVNRLGWTALMEAVILGEGGDVHAEIIDILLKAGADKNIPDAQGVKAVQHARKMGFEKIARLLE